MNSSSQSGWRFVDTQGTFELDDPQDTSYLFLPLVNEAGMFSCVTPKLNGDAKADQNSFLLLPTSVEDLHNSRAARNFWVTVNGRPWSVTGNSAEKNARKDESVRLRAGLLWQTVSRLHPSGFLRAETTSFVPAGEDRVEVMRVVLTNVGKADLTLTPTAAVPIFGRSADNLRDHRHVTSLLHRTACHRHGVIVRPTLSFDERGHTLNRLRYAVLGAEGDGVPPAGFFPLLEDFIGEGGALDWPKAVVANLKPAQSEGPAPAGYESIGALRFADRALRPGQSATYVILLAILPEEQDPEALLNRYASAERCEHWLAETRAFWSQKLAALCFETGEARVDGWLQWVAVQPILRRWMGNSFLPYHDYGRGGRGWRDLWQDALALLLTEGADFADMLAENFAGVRIDGSNATIIGSRPGEFKADRNNIPRVWMDHGAWPLLTVQLYLDLTGDLDFLLREQTYFKDHLSHRCRRDDPLWSAEQGTGLKTAGGSPARGTLLEHMLVQHLVSFHNVGGHNILRLEGADWNDALDMAAEKGESVAFSALYAHNLRVLSGLFQALADKGVTEVALAEELSTLLNPVDYSSTQEKQNQLQGYFERVAHTVSGGKIRIRTADLAGDLRGKADWLTGHLRSQEWLTDRDGFGWFNGYYDNDGLRVEGDSDSGPRMTLTGQVFALMGGIASDAQAREIVRSADRYLFDESVGGYRLNNDFGGRMNKLGRAFGFAYGHKENGAMFSHMAVMFANALYRRGMAAEGWRVLEGIYRQSQDFTRSRMYPGLPEYFNPRGRGMYPFLTGSASWYLLTLLTEVFGVKGRLGDLVLAPRFSSGLMAGGDALKVHTAFAGKTLEIEYRNPKRLSCEQYRISAVEINGKPRAAAPDGLEVIFPREEIGSWPEPTHIVVQLGN
ncbi:MAG: cellobiose phosphorylase [Anaerolineales bacterium]|nr:cellobiose phosphorylase [Anaerolineales bacterium]